jgi:4a-hydroxytetrahydrobiopterin dehydratase
MMSKASILTTLRGKRCAPAHGALAADRVKELLGALKEWEKSGGMICRTYRFKNYYETLAFVNGVAWIAHREDHHPDLEVGYNKCTVKYSTHSVGGLSENDFICAAKVDGLLEM